MKNALRVYGVCIASFAMLSIISGWLPISIRTDTAQLFRTLTEGFSSALLGYLSSFAFKE